MLNVFIFFYVSLNYQICIHIGQGTPKHIFICIGLKNGTQIDLYLPKKMNQKLTFLSFYLLEKFSTIIFVFVFVPENCIFHTMKFYRLEVHKSSQVGKKLWQC